jgi:hypothetical protein
MLAFGLPSFLSGGVVIGAISFVVGCFTPAIGRKVKAFLVGEEQKLVKKF